MPNSTTLKTGISGSNTLARTLQTASSREAAFASGFIVAGSVIARLPLRSGVGPLQMLHFRQHVTQVLRVHPFLTVPGITGTRGARQGRLSQHLVDLRRPSRL